MIFKIRYVPGFHVHASLWVAPYRDHTFAKAGDFVLRAEEFDALRDLCEGIEFCEETRESMRDCELAAYHRKMSEIARQRWAKRTPEEREGVRQKIVAGFAKKRGAD